MINVPENKVPESFFDSIDEEHVMKAAMNIKGSAWPSGRMDSELYRRVICSRSFKRAGKALRERIILFAKNIGRKFYDQQLLEAYTASRLIPLGQKSWMQAYWYWRSPAPYCWESLQKVSIS